MGHLKSEKGMVIIEATMVFPVMFLVVLLLLFMGNSSLGKSKIEAIVSELTVEGAAYCADPILRTVDKNGELPSFDANPEPYRTFGDMDAIKISIETELKHRLGNLSGGLFSGLNPKLSKATVHFNNHILYATFSIDVEYNIPIPIRLLGTKDDFSIKGFTHSETVVLNVPEFIRNVQMIEDMLEQTGAKETIQQAMDKTKEWFEK